MLYGIALLIAELTIWFIANTSSQPIERTMNLIYVSGCTVLIAVMFAPACMNASQAAQNCWIVVISANLVIGVSLLRLVEHCPALRR